MDGDGAVELAYIDRPHLAKTLRVWRFETDSLREITNLAGLTNHQIGQNFISGGLRDCGQGVELITVDANWQNVMATRLKADKLQSRSIGHFRAQSDIKAAMSCQN